MTAQYTAAILIASDKAATGRRADATGPALRALLEDNGYQVAQIIVSQDDELELAGIMRRICDSGEAALLLTAGGTGFSPRDTTPEATLAVAERIAPGLAEAMRAASMHITPRAMLSRGVAAIRGGTLIINLPGSPKSACENLAVVLPALGHGLDILRGAAGECAQAGTEHEALLAVSIPVRQHPVDNAADGE